MSAPAEDEDFAHLEQFEAFQCVSCPGILLLWSRIDHYCDDCGSLLKKVGPLHPSTVDVLRVACGHRDELRF
jgi:hypothetical protein